jgi:hypothetical protein
MAARLADFIIGGAARSGTTWLYTLLDHHSGIFMAKPVAPEPKFFLVDEIYNKGIDSYKSLFASATPGQITGEKSTNYLENAAAAKRIHQHIPKVKLVFILRDPVERAYSNYLWSRMNGLESESFADALAKEEERERTMPEAHRFSRPHAYFSRGRYADLLKPYFSLFPKEQVLCLRYEDIAEAPQTLAGNLHRFLGVPPRPDDALTLGKINAARQDEPIPPQERDALRKKYAEPNRQLAGLLGNAFKIWRYDQ